MKYYFLMNRENSASAGDITNNESLIQNSHFPLQDEGFEAMRAMHMKGRALKIGETMEEYITERQQSWEELSIKIESQSAIFKETQQSMQQASIEVSYQNQKADDAKKIAKIETSLGIGRQSDSPEKSTQNVDTSMIESGTKSGQKVDQDLLNYVMSDATEVQKMGYATLSQEEKKILGSIKLNFRTALTQVQKDSSVKISIREFVFQKMPDVFEDYDTLLFRSKSVSFQGEMWSTLNDTERREFLSHQNEASQIFTRMQNGEEFMDFSLTDAEKALLEKSHALSQVSRDIKVAAGTEIQPDDLKQRLAYALTGSMQGELFDKKDKIVYENFLQKVTFRLTKEKTFRDQSFVLEESGIDLDDNTSPEFSRAQSVAPEIIATTTIEGEKKWQEVIRVSDQEAIGDLNGSYDSFVAHLEERGLIRQNTTGIEWMGGNKRVVFVGDILGDRSPTGLKVMEALASLNNEAKKQGGSVDSLAGNHDNMFAAVLGGYDTEFETPVDKDERIFDYRGTLESAFYADNTFKQYVVDAFKKSYSSRVSDLKGVIAKKQSILVKLGQQNSSPELIEVFKRGLADAQADMDELNDVYANITVDDESRFMASLKYLGHGDAIQIGKALVKNRKAVVSNMKKSESGQARLEAVCSQKIATCIDDTLYTHTNLTTSMVQELLKGNTIQEGIQAINDLYQKGLRYHILGEGSMSEVELKNFDSLRTQFISTSSQSRINYTEDQKTSVEDKQRLQDQLKKQGINLVIHGHTDEKGSVKGTSDLPIVSIDRSVYKGDESYGTNSPKATLTIDTQGNVKSNEAGQVIREN
ncbi:MAG: hypothetical protein QG568_763 [Patescibacteria group bacterium]|nr:hypothetical protein [Patescibacteria group bacterium]